MFEPSLGEFFEWQVHATSWVGGSLLGQWFHGQKADLKINPTLGYAGGYAEIFRVNATLVALAFGVTARVSRQWIDHP